MMKNTNAQYLNDKKLIQDKKERDMEDKMNKCSKCGKKKFLFHIIDGEKICDNCKD